MVNSSINSLRARKRRNRLQSPEPPSLDPESAAVTNECHQKMIEAMGVLTDQHRTVVTLRDLRGYAYPDIARIMGVPEGTVKSSLNRGRTRLMKEMQARATGTDDVPMYTLLE